MTLDNDFLDQVAGRPPVHVLVLLVIMALLLAANAFAQPCVSSTGNNATVIAPPSASIGLLADDLIEALYVDPLTLDTLCAGLGLYHDDEFHITVWGDNPLTPDVDGMPAGAMIEYRARRPSTGLSTTDIVVVYAAGSGLYAADAIYTLSLFATLGNLPVELTSFTATADGADVILSWETAAETNNAGFEVEHQNDSVFHRLAFVDGHGTTDLPQHYSYRARALGAGRHRFRLKQVDFDGRFEYSEEVEVVVELPTAFLLTAPYPNPFNPSTSLNLMVKRRQHLTVSVYDALGRRVGVLFRGMMGADEARALVFEARMLPSGAYVIHVVGEAFAAARRVVLIR